MTTNNHKSIVDLVIIIIISVISYWFFGLFDVLETLVEFSSRYERYEIDEILCTFIVLCFCLIFFSIRRWREALETKNIIYQKNQELQKYINEIKQLKGILPLCSFCKDIRNDSGYWEHVDTYIQKHSEADISHGICPDCLKKHYPTEFEKIHSEKTKT